MDRFKGLRRVVAVLAVLFVSGLALLVWMIPVRSFLTWAVVVAQAVVVIYYTVLSVGLIREAEEREKTGSEGGRRKPGSLVYRHCLNYK